MQVHISNCETLTRAQNTLELQISLATNAPIRLGADRIGLFLGTYAADAAGWPPQAVSMLYLFPRLLIASCHCCKGLLDPLLQQRQSGRVQPRLPPFCEALTDAPLLDLI